MAWDTSKFNWQENPESGVGQWLDPAHGGASAYDASLTPRGKIDAPTEASLRKLGFSGDMFTDIPDSQSSQDYGGHNLSSTLSPAFEDWMQKTGVTPSAYASGDGSNIDFNNAGGLIGSTHNQAMQSPEFMAAALLGGGMFLGPGLAAGMGTSDAGGIGLAEGAYPESITGASAGGSSAIPGGEAASYSHEGTNALTDLGNMGGAGTATVPFQQVSATGGIGDLLGNAKKTIGIGQDLLNVGSGGRTGASPSSLSQNGLSSGDRFRQQLLAQSLRDRAQQAPSQAMPGWIGG